MNTRLDVTDSLIEELTMQVAPMVEEATGWGLDLPNLNSRALPKNQGYEEIIIGRIRGAGIDFRADGARSLLERLMEYLIENNTLAAYEPSAAEILIVRENVDDSNLDGLKLVIAHELVHRGQHVNHPAIIDRMNAMIRCVFRQIEVERDVPAAMETARTIQPLMALIEGHAQHVQEVIHRHSLPDARVESHLNLAVLLMRLFGAQKVSQYTECIPEIQAAIAQGKSEELYTAVD